MRAGITSKQPNDRLQHEREARGWTQQYVAEQLRAEMNIVSRWERGERKPGPYYRRMLIELFGKSAVDLGLVKAPPPASLSSNSAQRIPQHQMAVSGTPLMTGMREDSLDKQAGLGAYPSQVAGEQSLVLGGGTSPALWLGGPPELLRTHQSLDLLRQTEQTSPEQRLGAWLALGASDLATLFDEGWSLEEILTSLRIVLQGEQVVPNISRRAFGRRVRELIVAAVVSGIPIPTGEHISIERRIQLHQVLGTALADGWKLFHTAGTAQVLAVGRAQLVQVQEASAYLYPSVRPLYYSGVHRLIGAALHFQGKYEEAHQAHEKAYVAALEGADSWNMAQSRGWQAYGLKAQEDYLEAIDTADAALRLVFSQQDTECIRLRARLLAFSAENAAVLGQTDEVQRRLDASEALLEYLPGAHEEFDRTSWLQQAGTCALSLKQYKLAAERLQQAINELPEQWILRTVSTAIPLASAFTRQKERDRALTIAEQTLPVVKSSQSPTLVREFTSFLHEELLAQFPNDSRCRTFTAEAQRQLALA